MKRRIRLAMGLACCLPLAGFVPAAHATGGAACSISGTITFKHSPSNTTQGVWTIEPAIISCNGLYNGYERILGPGKFTGSGTFSALAGGSGTCARNVGSGTVDYMFPTTASDVHLVERNSYMLTGVGWFNSPSLNGTFEISPPYEGDCVTTPVTKAIFVAEAALTRFVPPDPNRYLPPKR